VNHHFLVLQSLHSDRNSPLVAPIKICGHLWLLILLWWLFNFLQTHQCGMFHMRSFQTIGFDRLHVPNVFIGMHMAHTACTPKCKVWLFWVEIGKLVLSCQHMHLKILMHKLLFWLQHAVNAAHWWCCYLHWAPINFICERRGACCKQCFCWVTEWTWNEWSVTDRHNDNSSLVLDSYQH